MRLSPWGGASNMSMPSFAPAGRISLILAPPNMSCAPCPMDSILHSVQPRTLPRMAPACLAPMTAQQSPALPWAGTRIFTLPCADMAITDSAPLSTLIAQDAQSTAFDAFLMALLSAPIVVFMRFPFKNTRNRATKKGKGKEFDDLAD